MEKGIVRYPRLWLLLLLLAMALVAGAVIVPRDVRGQAALSAAGAASSDPAPVTEQDLASMLQLPCEGTPEPGAVLTVLQQDVGGYVGTADTTLEPDLPDNNLSTDRYLHLGYKGKISALIRFNLSPIPANSRILCAALLLLPESSGSDDVFAMDVGAYRVLRPWVSTEATYMRASAEEYWASPGCNGAADRSFTAESIQTITDMLVWYSFPMTELVDGWVHGTIPNYGLSLQPVQSVEDTDDVFMDSADDRSPAGLPEYRPKLVILHVSAPTPTPTQPLVPTDTPTPTAPPTVTATATAPATATATATAVASATPSSTSMPTPTATGTTTPAPTATATATATSTPVNTPTSTPVRTPTSTPARRPVYLPLLLNHPVPRCLSWGTQFSEEFNDPALPRWSVNLAYGRQEVKDSFLHLWVPMQMDRFPLVWRNDLFQGLGNDFLFEVRFHYSDPTAYGTTISLSSAAFDGSRFPASSPPPSGPQYILNIQHVFDVAAPSNNRFEAELFGGAVKWAGTAGDAGWHVVQVSLENGDYYTLYVDGSRIGSVTSATRPVGLYLGNPTIQYWYGQWSQLYLDYVHVSRCLIWGW
jgi:hypothetical protein